MTQHLITVDAAQDCFERAEDNAGCCDCPSLTTFRQHWRLEILEEVHNRNFDPTELEAEDE